MKDKCLEVVVLLIKLEILPVTTSKHEKLERWQSHIFPPVKGNNSLECIWGFMFKCELNVRF